MGKRKEDREHFNYYEVFVRDRISSLRLDKNMSETELSEVLGNSRTYINNITSGKCLPSLNELFKICDYFEISPCDFFNEKSDNPELIARILNSLNNLNSNDLELISNLINRLIGK